VAAQQDAIGAPLEQRVHRVLHHGRYFMGPEVQELEHALAARWRATWPGPRWRRAACRA